MSSKKPNKKKKKKSVKRTVDSNNMPFIEFPILIHSEFVPKLTPSMHEIDRNRVREDALKHRTNGLLPEELMFDTDQNGTKTARTDPFSNNPLHYMLLDPKYVYGVTIHQLKQIYKSEESGPPASSQAFNNAMTSVLTALEKIYEDLYTNDHLFPFTKLSVERSEETDSYHKGDKRTLKTRVIPVFMLPYFLKTRTFTDQTGLSQNIDEFSRRLRNFNLKNPDLQHYHNSYLQLTANLRFILSQTAATAEKLQLNLKDYARTSRKITETIKVLEEKVEDLEEKVEDLECDARLSSDKYKRLKRKINHRKETKKRQKTE